MKGNNSPNRLTVTNPFNSTATSPRPKQHLMMSRTQDNSFRVSRRSEAALLPSLDMQNVSFDSTVQVKVNLKSIDRLRPANLMISLHG